MSPATPLVSNPEPHPELNSATTCRNCQTPTTGRYCPECGQRRARRITFRRVFNEGLEHVMSLDSAFLRTVVDLSRRPGQVCREYLEGQRKAFVNPIKYTFFMATVFALVVNLLDIVPASIPVDNKSAVQTYKVVVSALGYMAYLYMLPVAALQAWLFRRPRYGVAECYTTLLFFYGQFLILGTILAVAGVYSSPYGILIVRGLGLLYFLWLLARLYDETFGWTLVKGILLYLFFNFVNIDSGFLIGLAVGLTLNG